MIHYYESIIHKLEEMETLNREAKSIYEQKEKIKQNIKKIKLSHNARDSL